MLKISLKEFSKETAKELLKAISKLSIKEIKGEGTFEVVMTKEVVDRDGEIVSVAGIDTVNFMKNPVLLFGHNYWDYPIGAITEIVKNGDEMIAKGVFARTEEGQKARVLYDDGILKAVSIGFIAKTREGNNIKTSELLELSFVPVPSNPDALDSAKQVKELEDMMKKTAKVTKSDDEPTDEEKAEAKAKLEADIKAFFADDSLEDEAKTAKYAELKEAYEALGGTMPELKEMTAYELDNLFVKEKDPIPEDAKGQIDYIIKTLKQDVNSLVADATERIGTVMGDVKSDAEPTQKAGRTLSAKTKTSITNAVEAMDKAVKELKTLLESVDSNGDDEDEEKKKADAQLLKMLQSIDKTVEAGILTVKNRVKK